MYNTFLLQDCLNAVGKHFHPECFLCAYCGKTFGNNPFYLEDGLPYCEDGKWRPCIHFSSFIEVKQERQLLLVLFLMFAIPKCVTHI